nr:MAG TPA: hypothetical protein [Caudoviricetes sp.]
MLRGSGEHWPIAPFFFDQDTPVSRSDRLLYALFTPMPSFSPTPLSFILYKSFVTL